MNDKPAPHPLEIPPFLQRNPDGSLKQPPKPKVTPERAAEIAAIPDEAIDTSDIPEATPEWFAKAQWKVPDRIAKRNARRRAHNAGFDAARTALKAGPVTLYRLAAEHPEIPKPSLRFGLRLHVRKRLAWLDGKTYRPGRKP